MKTKIILILLTGIAATINAQPWNETTSGDIYYNLGNVGIGTQTPLELLHIKSSSAYPRISVQSTHSNGAPGFDIRDASGNAKFTWHYDFTGGFMGFYQTGFGNRMIIKDNGNVGIGTSNPNYSLEVRGNVNSNTAFFGSDLSTVSSPFPSQVSIWGTASNSEARLAFGTTMAGGVTGHTGMIKTIVPTEGGGHMVFQTREPNFNGLIEVIRVTNLGKVGIGTINPDAKLTVAGDIHSKEVRVTINAGSDFVFNDNYDLRTLTEVEHFIKQHRHLPDIESAKVMEENGLELGKMDMRLLQKIEELTLYMIDFKKEMDKIKEENQKLKERIIELEKD